MTLSEIYNLGHVDAGNVTSIIASLRTNNIDVSSFLAKSSLGNDGALLTLGNGNALFEGLVSNNFAFSQNQQQFMAETQSGVDKLYSDAGYVKDFFGNWSNPESNPTNFQLQQKVWDYQQSRSLDKYFGLGNMFSSSVEDNIAYFSTKNNNFLGNAKTASLLSRINNNASSGIISSLSDEGQQYAIQNYGFLQGVSKSDDADPWESFATQFLLPSIAIIFGGPIGASLATAYMMHADELLINQLAYLGVIPEDQVGIYYAVVHTVLSSAMTYYGFNGLINTIGPGEMSTYLAIHDAIYSGLTSLGVDSALASSIAFNIVYAYDIIMTYSYLIDIYSALDNVYQAYMQMRMYEQMYEQALAAFDSWWKSQQQLSYVNDNFISGQTNGIAGLHMPGRQLFSAAMAGRENYPGIEGLMSGRVMVEGRLIEEDMFIARISFDNPRYDMPGNFSYMNTTQDYPKFWRVV